MALPRTHALCVCGVCMGSRQKFVPCYGDGGDDDDDDALGGVEERKSLAWRMRETQISPSLGPPFFPCMLSLSLPS